MPSRGGRDRSPPEVLASEDDGGVLFAVRGGARGRRPPPGERIGCRSRYLWMIRADMKRIWCAISSHGFGHAAQAVPVLNELGRRVSGLTAILRTSVPARLFEADLQIAWEVSPAEQDVGCVQHGPIRIDVAATWGEHRRFHEQWEAQVAAEVRAIRSGKPALVLADISYLAIETAARAGVPGGVRGDRARWAPVRSAGPDARLSVRCERTSAGWDRTHPLVGLDPDGLRLTAGLRRSHRDQTWLFHGRQSGCLSDAGRVRASLQFCG